MTNFRLEQMWDKMLPGWDEAELAEDEHHYRITAMYDTAWKRTPVSELPIGTEISELTMAGKPFVCLICGESDRWTPEGEVVEDGVTHPRVFVCKHGVIDVGRGGIREINSVPIKIIGGVEIVD